jgi:hypothetical protein
LSESRVSVLDCGSPLPLWCRQSCGGKSGRGVPQSKTSRNYSHRLSKCGYSFIETALIRHPAQLRLCFLRRLA